MRRWILHVWVMLLVVVSIFPLSGAETGVVLRVGVETRDGSYLLGQPAFSNLAIRTSYADLRMGVEHISGIALTGNEGEASVSLRNGDKVKGILGTREIKIEGLLGVIAVRQDQIAAIRVMMGGGLGGSFLEGLLLHYTFDSKDKLAADSGPGQRDGTVRGAVYSGNGKRNGAAEFDGRSTFIETPAINNTRNLTWSLWAYPRTLGTGRIAQLMGLKGNAWVFNSNNSALFLDRTDGDSGIIGFYIQGPQGMVSAPIRLADVLRQWNHYVATIDNRGWHIYLNGVEVGTKEEPTRIGSSCAMTIGANDNGPQRYFDGFMDELMVFDRALPADEVQQLYESQK